MKKPFLLLFLFSLALFSKAQITIDVDEDRTEISPLIYGINGHASIEGITSVRQGGNRLSTYNWENNLSNAGKDYSNITDSYLSGSDVPAEYVTNFLSTHSGLYSLVTLQCGGYVASNRTGAAIAPPPSASWFKTEISKEGEILPYPNIQDSVVYMDEFISYVTNKEGKAGDGGPNAYSIDNEPDLWSSTHSIMHPAKARYSEVFTKSAKVGHMVKRLDPKAEVVGPALGGFKAIQNLEEAPDRSSYSKWFLEEYLKAMKAASDTAGIRLLDVVDVHWYPEDRPWSVRVVDLGGENTVEELTLPRVNEGRMQAPRALWDSTFINTTWIPVDKIQLIPRLKKMINNEFPGTKIGFTEFKFGAEFHYSGGIALADVLGIFGREGVYMAQKWDGLDSYAQSAYELYLDYDGVGSQYGKIAVKAQSNNNELFSTFASLDDENRLHIIVLNKYSNDTTLSMEINNGYYSSGVAYGFGEHSEAIVELDAIASLTNNTAFNYTFKAFSATHIILNPLQSGRIVEASSISPNTIELLTNEAIEETQSIENSAFNIDGNSITNVTISDANTILLTVENDITDRNQLLNFTGTIYDLNGYPLFHEEGIPIILKQPSTEPYVTSAIVFESGKQFAITFSKILNTHIPENTAFQVMSGDSTYVPSSIDASNDTLYLNFDNRIFGFLDLEITFSEDSIIAFDESKNFGFQLTNEAISNNGPASNVEITAVEIKNLGNTLNVHVNKDLVEELPANDGFTILVNETPVAYSASISERIIEFTMVNRFINTDTITIVFDETAGIKSRIGGYLNSFTLGVENNLAPPLEAVTIPARIEAEDVYDYVLSDRTKLEPCTDVDGNQSWGFTISGDKFSYLINNPTAGEYFVGIRHAARAANYMRIYIDDEIIDSVYIYPTGEYNIWKTTSCKLHMPEGEHKLTTEMKYNDLNFNWLSVGVETDYSPVRLISAEVPFNGNYVKYEFSHRINYAEISSFTLSVGGMEESFSNVEIKENKLTAYVTDTILKDQIVTTTINESNIEFFHANTIDNIVDSEVRNRSKIVKDAIATYSNNVLIYPNPIAPNNKVHIDLQQGTSELGFIQITNALGQIVYEDNVQIVQGKLDISIPNNVSGLTNIKINTSKNIYTATLLIE